MIIQCYFLYENNITFQKKIIHPEELNIKSYQIFIKILSSTDIYSNIKYSSNYINNSLYYKQISHNQNNCQSIIISFVTEFAY